VPSTATIDTPPPTARRRFGAWIVAAVAGVIGVGATAAWITASRPSGTQVAAPDVAASAPAEPAALPTPAKVPATTAAVGDLTSGGPDTASPAARAKPNDKPARSTDTAAAAFAHREEVRAQDQRHAAARDENPRTQGSMGQPAPAVPVTATAQDTASPREACGHRVFIAMAICMEEQCERPRFKTHPQCERVREIVERRRRGDGGGGGG
jgi:hypothetical protein